MASNTPLHLERVFLKNSRHIVDLTVTSRASNAFSNVNTVIEVRVLRQIVNPLPLDWLVIAKTRPDGLEVGAVLPNLAVAVHACLSRRHACRGCRFHRGMAIAAIDAVIARVVLVAELDRLLSLQITAR